MPDHSPKASNPAAQGQKKQRGLQNWKYYGAPFAGSTIQALTSPSTSLVADVPENRLLQSQKSDYTADQLQKKGALCREVIRISRVPYLHSSRTDIDSDPIRRHMQEDRVQEMALLFVLTCRGDWTEKPEIQVAKGALRDAAFGLDRWRDTHIDVPAMISFQWETGLLADLLVRKFCLPVPGNKRCVDYNLLNWEHGTQRGWYRRNLIFACVRWAAFAPEPAIEQGPRFTRFERYITAALLESNLSLFEASAVVTKMADFMARVRLYHETKIMSQPSVLKLGREWAASRGYIVRMWDYSELPYMPHLEGEDEWDSEEDQE